MFLHNKMNITYISKSLVYLFVLGIICFVSKAEAIKINVSICTDKDFVHSVGKILKLKCNKEILNEGIIKIDKINSIHAALQVGNLEKIWNTSQENAHEKLQIHWIFHSDIPITDTVNFGKEGTFYESQNRGELSHLDPKFKIAEEIYEGSSLKTFWAAVEVLVGRRNDYRTHSSKIIDKDFHIGKWEVRIYEIGKVINGQQQSIFNLEFEIIE